MCKCCCIYLNGLKQTYNLKGNESGDTSLTHTVQITAHPSGAAAQTKTESFSDGSFTVPLLPLLLLSSSFLAG